MEPDQTDIELLDRYFRNELTSEELAVLQSKMKDVDFASAAKSHFEALSIIQSAGRIELMSSLTTIQKMLSSKMVLINTNQLNPEKEVAAEVVVVFQ